METLGQVFKTARERKRVTLTQAASKTRIKIQHLEMMERDDFTKMPAPAYARGFIRMYAEFLGLESTSLIEEYNTLHQPGERSVAQRNRPATPLPQPPDDGEGEPSDAPPRAKERREPSAALRAVMANVKAALSVANLRRAAIIIGVVVVCWLLVTGVSRCVRTAEQHEEKPQAPHLKKGVPAVVENPAEPYLPLPARSGDAE